MKHDYHVGQSVTVWGLREPTAVRTLVAVGALKVKDSKGEEWRISDGRKWGTERGGWGAYSCIQPSRPGEAERVAFLIRRAAAIAELERALSVMRSATPEQARPYFDMLDTMKEKQP